MKVLVLIDETSWFHQFKDELTRDLLLTRPEIEFTFASDHRELSGSWDECLMISYSRIVDSEFLKRSRNNLVVHESALPKGKGMSPLTWQVLEGKSEIPVTLFEASEGLDAGVIYFTDLIRLEGHELVDELRVKQARSTIDLLVKFFASASPPVGRKQEGEESFYPRRRPADSRLDPHKSIIEQFNLLRVCDNTKYPAYFEHLGHKYIVRVGKAK